MACCLQLSKVRLLTLYVLIQRFFPYLFFFYRVHIRCEFDLLCVSTSAWQQEVFYFWCACSVSALVISYRTNLLKLSESRFPFIKRNLSWLPPPPPVGKKKSKHFFLRKGPRSFPVTNHCRLLVQKTRRVKNIPFATKDQKRKIFLSRCKTRRVKILMSLRKTKRVKTSYFMFLI